MMLAFSFLLFFSFLLRKDCYLTDTGKENVNSKKLKSEELPSERGFMA